MLEDATGRDGFDEVWCLGDTVGYGPDPGGCIELLRQQNYICVVGNHDLAAVCRLSASDVNSHARAAARWTAAQLVPEHAQFLASLPEVVQRGEFTLVHGSLRLPVLEYLMSDEAVMDTFKLLGSRFCLVGHSHIPFICREVDFQSGFEHFPEESNVPLDKERLIINPRGIGQPRDHDPRPSYAIYNSDERTIRRFRVSYQFDAT